MSDQPLVNDIKATVFKQFSVKWNEFGKAAFLAGLAIPFAVLVNALIKGEWPEMPDLVQALKIGLGTMLAVISRDFFKPTITVIKGQVEPQAKVVSPTTVVTKDINPDEK